MTGANPVDGEYIPPGSAGEMVTRREVAEREPPRIDGRLKSVTIETMDGRRVVLAYCTAVDYEFTYRREPIGGGPRAYSPTRFDGKVTLKFEDIILEAE